MGLTFIRCEKKPTKAKGFEHPPPLTALENAVSRRKTIGKGGLLLCF